MKPKQCKDVQYTLDNTIGCESEEEEGRGGSNDLRYNLVETK